MILLTCVDVASRGISVAAEAAAPRAAAEVAFRAVEAAASMRRLGLDLPT